LRRNLGKIHPLLTLVLLLLFSGISFFSNAALNITPLPPYLAETKGTPMIMINLSKDHQLFYKAYNEYSDLDGDGELETQYKHSYRYYGYFDNQRCYVYDTTNELYVPTRKVNATDSYCGGADEWAGNFLNWASMTRMDVVRRILYGGFRSTDTSVANGTSTTVLERAHLPPDAHAFAKYYRGTDIRLLTPFTPTTTTFTVTTGTGTASVTAQQITLCNATFKNGSVNYSHGAIGAPRILVAEGNFSLWNANERAQCYFSEDDNRSNGNDPTKSGIFAASSNPSRATHGMGRTGADKGRYTARVEVCKVSLLNDPTDDEKARCKLYPLGNYKPIGLLQNYGERNEAAFGLITGSYDKNVSGGVLRKNIGFFTDEIDLDDGQFKNVNGIVKTINSLRIYGYKYGDGTYADDGCSFGLTSLTEGSCTSWGNPMGEMYLEALRYFAGQQPTAAFNNVSGTKDNAIGISAVTWTDPHGSSTVATFGDRLCRRNSIVNFNASVTSYDHNQWSGASDLANFSEAALRTYTNKIGEAEGLYASGKTWAVGLNGGTTAAETDELCSYKSISALADVKGICPEAPTYEGSYKVAGAALYARTNPVRSDITIPANYKRSFSVDTYSVALATGTPRISVAVPNQPGKFVVIQPAARLTKSSTDFGGGALVDFRVVVQTPTYGKYVIQWEDSEQGGDYDQDLWGTLEYSVTTTVGGISTIRITTDVVSDSTPYKIGFGYVISGTNGKDGVHFHSGIRGFTYTDPANISVTPTTKVNSSGGCEDCKEPDAATSVVYTMAGQNNEVLKDPFWYAAKYGGFDGKSVSGTYTLGSTLPVSAWDKKSSAGSATPDGTPDSYFYAIDPGQLERSLRTVFDDILKAGGAAPAAATSSRTAAGGYVYVSTHSIQPSAPDADADASGQFLRYSLTATGEVASTSDWDGGAKLTTQNWNNGRAILSMSENGPIRFRWSDLTADQKTALNKNGSGTVDSRGEDRLKWLRGDITHEVTRTLTVTAGVTTISGGLRARPKTKLGAILNSTPWYIGRPSAGYTDSQYGGGYASYRNNNTTTNAVFVAANDGMLHAFNGATGDELFAYIPRTMYPKLSGITDKDFALNSGTDNVNMDGSIMVADMKPTGNWRSYLFGSFGRGAKGVYALDVTSPHTVAENSTSTLVKWEFSSAQDPDIGHIVGRTNPRNNGQPQQTGYMANGKWAAIYGNGYNSVSGKAHLFIFFADGPGNTTTTWTPFTHYVKIPTGASGDGPDNGLASPTAVDTDNDGDIDVIYAGDLKGNIWKFDVSSTDPANWKLATTDDTPLYQAKTTLTGSTTVVAQPITTAIQPFPHPSGGYLLLAGTGKMLESTDYPMASPFVNSIYGIHDRPGTTTTITVGRTSLTEQTLSFSATSGYRYLSNNKVDYLTKRGWFIDLPVSSETIPFNPLFEDINRVNLKSIAPNADSDGCKRESTGFDMTFNPITGNPIPGLLSGDFTENAIGGAAKNSFEFARGGVYTPPKICTPATCPATCKLGSPGYKANPNNANEAVCCTAGAPCCLPWDPSTCKSDQCLYRTFNALGTGDVEAVERYGSCNEGRLTWREILRVNN
jgi:type IV pilus assembly protein PilY1